MFVNLGSCYIQTQNIRVINTASKKIHDYQGYTHDVTVDMDALTAQIVEADKDNHVLIPDVFNSLV